MKVDSYPYFVTVDAETEIIADGVETISAIRDQVENAAGCRIPIVWFVRFQRNWADSVHKEAVEFFNGPVNIDRAFDGYALAEDQLRRMQDRGDEIAWHYHAYGYVHRDDLDHDLKVAILKADMLACAAELRRRHPAFSPRSLRFGWWFIPDYAVFPPLAEAGFDVDASIQPDRGGNVSQFAARYLPPLTRDIARIDGTWFFPFNNTLCLHDWNVVAHRFKWREQAEEEAADRRKAFRDELTRIATKVQRSDGCCTTYLDYLREWKAGQRR